MTTEKQIEANKQNAKLGGVKTEQGKTISKYNALKHGLLAKEILMKDENENELLNLEKKLRNELGPATEIELILVDRIASNIWRLKRALSMEKSELFSEFSLNGKLSLQYDGERLLRYEVMLERAIYKAMHELERIQAKRFGATTPIPIAVDIDINQDKDNGFVS